MNRKSFNDVLKAKETEEELRKQQSADEHIKLDDAKRIKVLSPGLLVFKRFIRNKLAIFGSCVLIAMFIFSFLCPLIYPYSQTEIFYKYDYTNGDYGTASVRSDYTTFLLDDSATVDNSVMRNINSGIKKIETNDYEGLLLAADDGSSYYLKALGEKDYTLSTNSGAKVAVLGMNQKICKLETMGNTFTYEDESLGEAFETALLAAIEADTKEFTVDETTYGWEMTRKFNYEVKSVGASVRYTGEKLGSAFEAAAREALDAETNAFAVDGVSYLLNQADKNYEIYSIIDPKPVYVCSVMVFDAYDDSVAITDEFRINALLNAYNGESFEYNGASYYVSVEDESLVVYTQSGDQFGLLSNYVIRDTNGKDTFSIAFKEAAQSVVAELEETGADTGEFTAQFADQQAGFNGVEPYIETLHNEDGSVKMVDTPITVTRKVDVYKLTCFEWRHLMEVNGAPSSRHVFGTDGGGMDILARMMYGGQISLVVGFIVVILETLLGVIMGGIAGYFGGWVDNLIMRLVDIFYCIPSMPILIIMGAFMDSAKLDAYTRLAWMMVILGVLGWAAVARLVRGQILSLREQEFMIAAEATGVKVGHRIFRHLLPNVMPQLIVSATAGLGGVILTESTLSFLGLGVKYPLATWGTMINSVTSSNENMIKYTYIWIPVGMLICLTVIAFNFVGDGLRDAFDPKMKR